MSVSLKAAHAEKLYMLSLIGVSGMLKISVAPSICS